METAEKLFKILMGFVALNIAFDEKNGEPDKAILKQRAANTGLLRTAVIAADFISANNLDKKYRKFEEEVNKEVAKIVARSKE